MELEADGSAVVKGMSCFDTPVHTCELANLLAARKGMGKSLHVMIGSPDELWQSWLLWPASPLPLPDLLPLQGR